MRIDGKSYKSLNFTMFPEKLRSKEKDQTYRVLFIPNFVEGEIIAIAYRKEFLYLAKVTAIIPKQLKDITEIEAKRDGFDSVKEFQEGIKRLNNIKSLKHWGFIIRFQAIPTVVDYLK